MWVLWTARISGSIILVFLLIFLLAYLVGDDESGNGFQGSHEVLAFIFFPVSTGIGLVTSYARAGLGGIITTAGILGLLILRPDLIGSLLMVPMVPGVMYIAYWIMTRHTKSPGLQAAVDNL